MNGASARNRGTGPDIVLVIVALSAFLFACVALLVAYYGGAFINSNPDETGGVCTASRNGWKYLQLGVALCATLAGAGALSSALASRRVAGWLVASAVLTVSWAVIVVAVMPEARTIPC